ncbi:MAG TPA: DMT family transporter [Kofleriaceae bacterium]|nr:DMT family transporter [Kofleriaceae bacterium]
MERSRLSPSGLVLLALVTLAWGLSWTAIKVVLAELPPLTFRAICLVGGGAGVLGLARLAGQSLRVPAGAWGRLLAIAAGSVIGWNVFLIYGIAALPSGRAALIGYTMPLWSTLLSVWLLGERLTARRAGSLVLGMAGVVVLLAGDLAGMASAAGGVVLMLAAALSWGFGVVLLKRFALPMPPACLTGWMMLAGSVPFVVGAVVLEHDRWRPVSASVWLGLTYSVVIAFMFGYWAYNRLVLMVPVAVSSVSILATPVVGVLSGMWLLHEPLTWREVVAGACIVGAIGLVLRSPARGAGER